MRKLFSILFSLVSFAIAAQNKIPISNWNSESAIEISDSVFGPTVIDTNTKIIIAIYFEAGKSVSIDGFEKCGWYKFKIKSDGLLTFDVIPESKSNSYGFSLFHYNNSNNMIAGWKAHPLIQCYNFYPGTINTNGLNLNSDKTSFSVKSKTKTDIRYCKPILAKAGEVYLLQVVVNTKLPGGIKPFSIHFHCALDQFPKPVILKNVLFETGKTNLLPQSNKELDGLVSKMKLKPSMTINISGHTDNQGNENDNLKLSEGRAKAVEDYLISKGIDKSRITHVGSGSKKPIASNDTDEGRKQNRRVEFTIVKE